MKSQDELRAATLALGHWFEAQGVDPTEGAWCAANFIGRAVSFHAQTPESLEEGLLILTSMIDFVAHIGFEKKQREKMQ